MANAYDPGLAETVTDDAAVAARCDQCMLNPTTLEHLDAPVHRVALANASQVDAHPWSGKAHRTVLRVEQHVSKIHARQCRFDLLRIRSHAALEVIQIADA